MKCLRSKKRLNGAATTTEVERGLGVLAWKRFGVAEGSELEWRARVLKFA
jgi:hypothetical protein